MLLLSLTFRVVFVMLLGKIRLCYLVVSWWSVYVCCLWSLSCLSGLEPDFRRQLDPLLVERAIKTFSRLRDTRTTVYTKSYTGKSGLLSVRHTVTALPLKTHLNTSSCRWYLKEKPICIRPRKAPWLSKKTKKFFLALPLSGFELF